MAEEKKQKKPRLKSSLYLPPNLLKKIERYKVNHDFSTRNSAIIDLLKKSLEKEY